MKFSQADFLIFSRVTFYSSRVNILKFQVIFFIFEREINFFCMGTEFFFPVKFAFFRGKNFLSSGSFQKIFLGSYNSSRAENRKFSHD